MTTDRLAALEARLQRFEDLHGIWELFMDYRRHVDARDFAAYATLFMSDGVFSGSLGVARGPAQIEALLDRTLEVFADDTTRTYHLVTNPEIELGDGRATTTTTFCHIERDQNDKPVISLVGRYFDEVVRDGPRWKFQLRQAVMDIPYAEPIRPD